MSNIHLSGDVVTKKAPKKDESYVNINAGPYVAVVKQNSDPERMGRIKVLVPALSKTNDPKVFQFGNFYERTKTLRFHRKN